MPRYFLSDMSTRRSRDLGDRVGMDIAKRLLEQDLAVLVVNSDETAAAVATDLGFEQPFELAAAVRADERMVFATRPGQPRNRNSRAKRPIRAVMEYRYGTLPEKT
jgi:hypothetical protein